MMKTGQEVRDNILTIVVTTTDRISAETCRTKMLVTKRCPTLNFSHAQLGNSSYRRNYPALIAPGAVCTWTMPSMAHVFPIRWNFDET